MRPVSLKFLAVFLLVAIEIPFVHVVNAPFARWHALVGITAFVLSCICAALERADRQLPA